MRGIMVKSNRNASESFPYLWDPFPAPFQMMRDLLGRDLWREMVRKDDASQSFSPAVDIVETQDSYRISVDLPGVKEDNVDVSVLGSQLTLSGHRERKNKQEGETGYRYEREYGSFCRTFTLPEATDAEQVTAELKDGVLTVHVPKKAEAQPRKVQIKK